jgi:neutral ceramidase
MIGNKLYEFAKNLIETATEEIAGPIDYRHSFVDLSALNLTVSNGASTKLCDPAMGYAFAAGTTDGPAMFSFTQGTTTDNLFLNNVSSSLSKPTEEQFKCQAPKPILINTGGMDVPHAWDPRIVPVQILCIGNFFIIATPNGLTTMVDRHQCCEKNFESLQLGGSWTNYSHCYQ